MDASLAYLLFIGVLLSLGTLTASVLPTRGARIGLGAALSLALVVDVTWFAAPLIDWSARLADGVWVGVFALILLLALLTARYYRTRGDLPAWEWPGRRELAILLVVIVGFGVVAALLPVPLDTDAQGFGYLALTLRDGGDYLTLAPWHPDIQSLYSPAFLGLIAHLSARFDLDISTLELIAGAITAALFVWLAYDLGCELDDRRTGRAFLIAALIGTGLVTAFMDSHYTALLALLFSLAFLTFVLRFLATGRWSSALFAALCLAAVPLSQPDTTIALIVGYAPWLLVLPFAKPRPSLRAWLVISAVIPLVALGIVAPWLISLRDLLGSTIESPFVVETSHWRTLVITQGGLSAVLAALGFWLGLRRRRPVDLLAMIWLIAIVEFSTLGLLERAIPAVMDPLLKYDYPFSLAWHGPIIPYIMLGGSALVWIANRLGAERVDRWVGRLAVPVAILGLGAIAAGVVYFDPLLSESKGHLSFYGAFSSEADVDALHWLRDNTPTDARILNHPGLYEADWAPVIAERDTIYFRMQPFFKGTAAVDAEQDALRAVWRDPADPANLDLLRAAGVSYVVLPQVFGNPASLTDMVRWKAPLPDAAAYLQTSLSRAPYLELVYDRDGAQVYAVIEPPAGDPNE